MITRGWLYSPGSFELSRLVRVVDELTVLFSVGEVAETYHSQDRSVLFHFYRKLRPKTLCPTVAYISEDMMWPAVSWKVIAEPTSFGLI